MRWDGLFADLEAQAAALDRAERAGEVEERTRTEIGAQRLRDRLRAAVDSDLGLICTGGLSVSGVLRRVGSDWLLVDEGGGRECLVPLAAVQSVRGVGRQVVTEIEGVVESRLGLRHALRGIARDRSAVRLHLADGSTLAATLDRVGADFVEAALHPAGEARRPADVREVRLVVLEALVAVRRGAVG